MIIIKHRVNTLEELIRTPHQFGVELDIRLRNGEVVISHDPLEVGNNFDLWLRHYNHQLLVINTKEDGLEDIIMTKLNEFAINNFFFLDQSFPTLYKFSRIFPGHCASRISDVESIETALKLQASWIWLDSHSGDWRYLIESLEMINRAGIKSCLVSPELQRVEFQKELQNIQKMLRFSGLSVDAVCTKFPEYWLQ